MRIVDRILVGLYVLIALVPIAFRVVPAPRLGVQGALAPTPRPDLSFTAVRDESFQDGFTKWFESTLGLKAYAIHLDNTVLYHLLGDNKPGSTVVIGHDDTLFIDEDVNYFNRDELMFDRPTLDRLVDKLARIQQHLAAEHRALVPLIIPSKTTIYRDKIPARWTRPLGDPRPSDTRLYRALVEALDRGGIRYVDARDLMVKSHDDRSLLWGIGARHWSDYSACLAMSAVAKQYVAITGNPMAFDCTGTLVPTSKSRDDYDLWRLLNAWRVPRDPQAAAVAFEHQAPHPTRPDTMIVGTSFGWGLMRKAELSEQFGKLRMDYYDKQVVTWPEDTHTSETPHTPAWRATFMKNDLYVLDLFETFLNAQGSYVDSFLDAMLIELERQ